MAQQSFIPRKDAPIQQALRFRFDVWIALAVGGLLIAGMLVVYSASLPTTFYAFKEHTFYLRRQFIAFLIGLVGIVVIMQFDYHFFRKLSLLIMGATIASLVVLQIIGEANFGATRGLFNNSIQPSEIAKLAMILYAAHWLSSKGERVQSLWYGLVPFAVMVGLICGLVVLQPDLSTAILIAIISFTMFFLAGADLKQITIAFLVAAALFYGVTTVLGHTGARIEGWQAALEDPRNAPDQVRWSIMALSIGHIRGTGIGQGVMKYRLQVPHTDGPFAVWGEEWGFIGCMFIILSFVFLAWRGFLVARQARDMYGFLLALGVTCWISTQALMNIAVITSTMPFTGIPMPFMSYGGTSLLITMLGVGILLNVSRDAQMGKTLKQQRKRQTSRGNR